MITGAAKVAGVVGWPVKHSLSPLIHNAWIEALGLDAVYVPFPVVEDAFETLILGLKAGGAVGVNVTLPFKTRALKMAQSASVDADFANAANLLIFQDARGIAADNTDAEGLLVALEQGAPDWKAVGGPVVVIGAGGAASGAIAALLEADAPAVRLCNRTEARAHEVAAATCQPNVRGFGFHELDQALHGVTAVVNATSAGLNGVGDLPPMDAAPPGAVFMDMVYSPLRTAFLQRAAARGHPTVDGLSMLIGQARPSFEAFFGVPPPPPEVVDVRALCLRALGEAG